MSLFCIVKMAFSTWLNIFLPQADRMNRGKEIIKKVNLNDDSHKRLIWNRRDWWNWIIAKICDKFILTLFEPFPSVYSLREWGLNQKKCSSNGKVFSESRCFGAMKNQKIKKFYGDPKTLSSFKNAGKLAFSQLNFSAATSLCTKVYKTKMESLKFRTKVIL